MTAAIERLTAAVADRYRIERELGAGGMATVYLAHDVKHDRKVALKVLRPELAAVIGAQRFLTEIRTTANLQHPHILPLFDSGEVDGTVYYVMPYIEGESLRDRLVREKQLPIADAVRLSGHVASALDYAHRQGVIHRDIKPANILLHDGSALVADFGIALAASSGGSTRMTETGMSLGTPQYMSPEQAMGERELDARSDIYALGCVTYEMLAGEPPLTGPNAQSIVAKVITDSPRPLVQLRRTVPDSVESAVLTALEKLPADRWSSAAEFAEELEREGASRRRTSGRAEQGIRLRIRGPVQLTAALITLVALTAGPFVLGRAGRGAALPLAFGRTAQVTTEPGMEILPAIFPDGRHVAYAAGNPVRMRIFVRPVAGGRAIPLTDDSLDVQSHPSWSVDGTRVLFLARAAVFSAPASGGAARQELPANRGNAVAWAAWAPDGTRLAFVVGDSLFVREGQGQVRALATMREPTLCSWAPDGAHIACAVGNPSYAGVGTLFGNKAPGRIVISAVNDGSLSTVGDSTSVNHGPVWSRDGRWIYFVSNKHGVTDVYAQRLARGARADGDPVRLTTGLGAHTISLTPDGRQLAYSVLTTTSNIWSLPVPVGAAVSGSSATQATSGSQTVEGLGVARDGTWLLYDASLRGSGDLYRMRLPGGEPEQLTADHEQDFAPTLSPDGREVAFHSFRSGTRDIYVLPLDGGALQTVTSSGLQEAAPNWSPDGSAISFTQLEGDGGIWVVRRRPDGTWAPPAMRDSTGFGGSWLPDGKWLLASSSVDGGVLHLVPVDSGARRVLVDPALPGHPSAQVGFASDDGRTVYFRGHDGRGNVGIWSIPTAGGVPRMLVRFDDPARPSTNPRWAFGANRFYFTIDERQSDLWVLDVLPHD